MRLNIAFFIFIGSLLFNMTGCSSTGNRSSFCVVSIPTPQLTGEKTAIENQMIGEYKELEKDAWIISSVDTNLQRGAEKTAATGDEELLAAMKIREFHEKRILDYKNEGAIGEGNDGFIAYRELHKYNNNKDLKKILLSVIEEENKARRTIFIKSLNKAGNKEPDNAEILAFGRIFAEEQRALALKNHWIQENSGKWIKKK